MSTASVQNGGNSGRALYQHYRETRESWATLPIGYKEKRPLHNDWTQRNFTDARFCTGSQNIGVKLGEPSAGLVDIDLDCEEARALAPRFLPPSTCFGRASSVRSHYLYIARGAKTIQFRDPSPGGKATLLELRSTGAQTVLPGSTHETGETIEWAENVAPVEIDESDLALRCARLAVACLLLRNGDTAGVERLARGQDPDLSQLPSEAVKAARRWLGLETERAGAAPRISPPAWADFVAVVGDRMPREEGNGRNELCLGFAGIAHRCSIPDQEAATALASLFAPDSPHHNNAMSVVRATYEKAGRTEHFKSTGPFDRHASFGEAFGREWWPRLLGDWKTDSTLACAAKWLQRVGDARYNTDRKEWFRFDGRRWMPWANAAADLCSYLRIHEAATLQNRRSNVQRDAQAMAGVTEREFDEDARLLAFKNGTLDVNTQKLREHRADDLITRASDVVFDLRASHALFNKYVADLTNHEADLARYLQRAVGYSLFGCGKEKVFFFAYGKADSGKSTFLRLIAALAGGHATFAAGRTFMLTRRSSGHSDDRASLKAARIVIADELPKRGTFDVEFLNRITGGAEMTDSHKGGRTFNWQPRCAIWLGSETAPAFDTQVEGFARRLRRIPFGGQFARDAGFWERISVPDVLAAALAWAWAGFLEYLTHGLGSCKAVEDSTAEYREEQSDLVRDFFEECCTSDSNAFTSTDTLHKAFTYWCREHGVQYVAPKERFSSELGHVAGVKPGRRGKLKTRGFDGIRLGADNDRSSVSPPLPPRLLHQQSEPN